MAATIKDAAMEPASTLEDLLATPGICQQVYLYLGCLGRFSLLRTCRSLKLQVMARPVALRTTRPAMARVADHACLYFILQVEKCVDTLKITSTPATSQVQAWRRQLAGSTGLRPRHLLLSNDFYNYGLLAAPDVAG
jgi:hypothetical protein